MTYAEKLKNPKWQKKRLEIMSRDEFYCHKCYSSEDTLTVHHLYYIKGNDPWDYPDDSFITLCEDCHEKEHELRPNSESILIDALRQKGYDYIDLRILAQAICFADKDDLRSFWGTIIPEDILMSHCNPDPQPIIGLK